MANGPQQERDALGRLIGAFRRLQEKRSAPPPPPEETEPPTPVRPGPARTP